MSDRHIEAGRLNSAIRSDQFVCLICLPGPHKCVESAWFRPLLRCRPTCTTDPIRAADLSAAGNITCTFRHSTDHVWLRPEPCAVRVFLRTVWLQASKRKLGVRGNLTVDPDSNENRTSGQTLYCPHRYLLQIIQPNTAKKDKSARLQWFPNRRKQGLQTSSSNKSPFVSFCDWILVMNTLTNQLGFNWLYS